MIPANASARKGPEGKYPLHYLVWHNRHRELEKEVRAGQVDIEQLDPRGRTPLHLATTLGHLECARVLLAHGADVGRENRSGWTVLQEAVSTRDLELVQLVLRYRDYQRVVKRLAGIPLLLMAGPPSCSLTPLQDTVPEAFASQLFTPGRQLIALRAVSRCFVPDTNQHVKGLAPPHPGISASSALSGVPSPPSPNTCPVAMELSAQEQEERRRRVRQEEEELERILRLSLTEQ